MCRLAKGKAGEQFVRFGYRNRLSGVKLDLDALAKLVSVCQVIM